MESKAARKVEEKAAHEKVKAKLQEILDVMNNYMRTHSDKIDGQEKDRFKNIKTIATAIYSYYGLPELFIEFEGNLGDMFSKLKEATEKKLTLDINSLKLLPELKPHYATPPMPQALHAFHDIKVKIQSEIASMWSLKGRGWSSLATALQNTIEDEKYDPIAQELGTNVYFIIYANALKMVEIFRAPNLYADYIHDALSPIKALYASDLKTAMFDNKSFLFLFSSSKKDGVQTYRKDHTSALMFGTEFSFCLQKDPKNKLDTGKYVPLLSTIHNMDAQQDVDSQMHSQVCYPLEYRPDKDDLVIPPPLKVKK